MSLKNHKISLVVDAVESYIANQEAHHRKMSFEEEYREFLKKHAVEYDERYVWD